MHFRIINEVMETSDSKTITMSVPSDAMAGFIAGQFLTFDIEIDGVRHSRCYSVSSSERDASAGSVSITVKKVRGGGVSAHLVDRPLQGTALSATGPQGEFNRAKIGEDGPLLLLAAGSGITPLMSMLRTRMQQPVASRPRALLLYANRDLGSAIFRDELVRMAQEDAGLDVRFLATRMREPGALFGRLSAVLIRELVPDLTMRRVAICGSMDFMAAAMEICMDLGVPAGNVFQERFGAALPVVATATTNAAERDSVQVVFDCSGQRFHMPRGANLLEAAERQGIRMESACRMGACGACIVRLTSGSVEMDHSGGISPRQQRQGLVLPCCSRVDDDIRLDTRISPVLPI